MARVAVVNVPYHVTQRGNARQLVLASDTERLVYLELLRHYTQLHELAGGPPWICKFGCPVLRGGKGGVLELFPLFAQRQAGGPCLA